MIADKFRIPAAAASGTAQSALRAAFVGLTALLLVAWLAAH